MNLHSANEVILFSIMKVVLIIAAFLATIKADTIYDNVVVDLDDLKENQSLVTRIVNGQAAAENQFPHQALVYISKLRGTSQCGGTLLSASWVLCAAHCIYKYSFFKISLSH